MSSKNSSRTISSSLIFNPTTHNSYITHNYSYYVRWGILSCRVVLYKSILLLSTRTGRWVIQQHRLWVYDKRIRLQYNDDDSNDDDGNERCETVEEEENICWICQDEITYPFLYVYTLYIDALLGLFGCCNISPGAYNI